MQPTFETQDQNPLIKKLLKFIENGEGNAPLAYGTSVEVLIKILKKSEVDPYPENDLPYIKDISRDYSHLYFFHPILEHLQNTTDPDALKLYDDLMYHLHNETEGFHEKEEQTLEGLTHERIIKSLEEYAESAALKNYVDFNLGMQVPMTVIFLLLRYYALDAFYNYSGSNSNSDYTNEELLNRWYYNYEEKIIKIKEAFKDKNNEIKDILTTAINRRGVIIFYQNKVIAENKIIFGEEDSRDIIIARDEPLSVDDIYGVVFLSEEDKAYAFSMLEASQ